MPENVMQQVIKFCVITMFYDHNMKENAWNEEIVIKKCQWCNNKGYCVHGIQNSVVIIGSSYKFIAIKTPVTYI